MCRFITQECQWCQYYSQWMPLIFLLPQHHCRKCGAVVCGACSNRKFLLPYQAERPLRVCISCYDALSAAQAEADRYVVTYRTSYRSHIIDNICEYCSCVLSPPPPQIWSTTFNLCHTSPKIRLRGMHACACACAHACIVNLHVHVLVTVLI